LDQGLARGIRWSNESPSAAGIGIEPDARKKLERLCRYLSRPAVSVERLELTAQGDVHYRLKTPYRLAT